MAPKKKGGKGKKGKKGKGKGIEDVVTAEEAVYMKKAEMESLNNRFFEV